MEKVRRYAWAGLLVLAALVALFGVGDMAGGISSDAAITLAMTGQTVEEVRDAAPAVARLADLGVGVGGATMLTLGLLWIYIVIAGVRRSERRAWLSMWTMPLWTALITVVYLAADRVAGTPPPPPMITGPVFLLSAIGLLILSRPRAAGVRAGDHDLLPAAPRAAPTP